ncbi:MAG TPA: hypothetical protein VMT58_07130, partial [Candidatus Binataceae bacterium]|nr:hypothetical protein [Candidatus Binataceae bacterium]
NDVGIRTIGDLAARDPADVTGKFGPAGAHLHELAMGIDPRPVIADWQRKSYGEENTFSRDLAIDSGELRDALIAHGDAIARRLRADGVRARTITLKVKLARPLGGGRYPILTRSHSVERPTDDGVEITRVAASLLSRVKERDKIRLAGIHAHNLIRAERAQPGLFDSPPPRDARRERLNRALDSVAKKFGDDAITRGLARADRAAPTLRIK